MTPGLNLLFQERYLVAEVILLAKEVGYATIVIVFSKEQTGAHLASIPIVLNLCSSKTCLRPFTSLVPVIIFCDFPANSGWALFIGITISFCFLCFPPFDLFMLNTQRASGLSDACAEDMSKTKSATHSRWASLKMEMALSIWTSNWVWSHHGSPPIPG